ncbi:hypothetical protein CDD80_7279 [Ophiocordyceps camponoti-rufipedis]|uniref:tRNA-binding domain-containing protein n=1 Tax=Ophiocordyceps camponoti-rufipedis TaxID=2004952 RepID=A0A2C5YMA0_9HYPO|nr:hypothetical protein CDD80_7279 [Ophiocordyceps camponoti-rufipedis]
MALSTTTYTPPEQAEITRWLTTASDLASETSLLRTLNAHLASRTTLLGAKPSEADIAVYRAVAPVVKAWGVEERTGEKGMPHVVRFVDYVQNAAVYGLEVGEGEKVQVDLEDVRFVPVDAGKMTLPDRTKAKPEAPTKKEKEKEKSKKAAKPQPASTPLSPSLIDLRVGRILKATTHPDADSLYVSTIAMGDEAETEDSVNYENQICRTVCSGLNGLIPLSEMQNRAVVVVCNLKPVKMRGVKSCAMVLAASPPGDDDHKGPVELVAPPEGAKPGQRVYFEGWGGAPEKLLNPKKKIWETFQPGFTTTDGLEVAFDAGRVETLGKTGLGKLVTDDGGVCTVKSLKSAVVR